MKRVCKACGVQLDDYVFVFQPLKTQQIIDDLKTKLPQVHFSMNTIEGNKVKLEIKQELNPEQITILENYFSSKNYVRDAEEEKKEVYG